MEAIRAGMNPGLTMVVGPPGTGKTDVAVQIISNLYHALYVRLVSPFLCFVCVFSRIYIYMEWVIKWQYIRCMLLNPLQSIHNPTAPASASCW